MHVGWALNLILPRVNENTNTFSAF